MKKILAIGGSNSKQSINKQFAVWAANELDGVDVEIIDLNDFEMPIYGIDKENEHGIPPEAHDFKSIVKNSDGVVLSLAEHNGSYSAAFKNITDWVSRIEKGTWAGKPMLLLATSPGGRGGQGVLSTAKAAMPHQGAELSGTFSLPAFGSNFDATVGISSDELRVEFQKQLALFKEAIG
ncbi:MAG: NAD(P)H-dependent oxidoreductase [Ekhidna sp.]